MKKPVIVALCCLLALSTGTAAFAEEPTPTPAPELVELSPEETAPQFYPDSISWQEDGGQLLVVKQYSVPYGTAVTDLTESGMQWGGADYTLWGVTESVEGGVTEEKEVTQDFELSVRSADAETARNDVKESVAYDDEYGLATMKSPFRTASIPRPALWVATRRLLFPPTVATTTRCRTMNGL